MRLNNGKDDIIKMEEFINNIGKYSFALTLSPQKQYKGFDPDIRIIKVYRDTQRFLLQYPYITYHIRPEISVSGNVHFHGVLNVKKDKDYEYNVFKLYMTFFQRAMDKYSISLKEIKTMKDQAEWNEYTLKNQLILKPVCKRCNVIYDLTQDYMEDCITKTNEPNILQQLGVL